MKIYNSTIDKSWVWGNKGGNLKVLEGFKPRIWRSQILVLNSLKRKCNLWISPNNSNIILLNQGLLLLPITAQLQTKQGPTIHHHFRTPRHLKHQIVSSNSPKNIKFPSQKRKKEERNWGIAIGIGNLIGSSDKDLEAQKITKLSNWILVEIWSYDKSFRHEWSTKTWDQLSEV